MRTPKLITLALTLLAGVALLAFAACGGDDDDDATTAPTGTSQSTGGSTNTGGAATATDAPDGGDDDPLAALQALGSGLEQTTGKTTYQVTNTAGTVSSMTFYSTPGKSRFDSGETNGQTTSYITDSDNSYVCSSTSESCLAYPGGTAGFNPFAAYISVATVSQYVAAAQLAGVDVDTSNETLAGVDAECFSWEDTSAASDIASGKLCFGEDGVMLYQEITGNTGTTKLEATEHTESVSDSDFDPPYTVSTLPPIPGQ
jgi:hypothetical protein